MGLKNELRRGLYTGVGSLVLTFASWMFFGAGRLVTPGFAVAHWVISAQPPSFLGYLSEEFEIAAIVDFVVWFALLWGVQNLCTQLGKQRRASGITKHWTNPLPRPGIWIGALLCAVPLSFYAVPAAAISMKLNTLRRPELFVVASFVLGFPVCFAGICGLYPVAGRYWPNSDGVIE
jgi:hypothetical protein